MRTEKEWIANFALGRFHAEEHQITAIQTDARADLLERIKALEEELIDVKALLEIRSNFADAQQREKVKAHAQLTQYRVALERCVGALEAYRDAICAPEVFFALGGKPTEALIKAGELHKSSLALATPLIEKGRK